MKKYEQHITSLLRNRAITALIAIVSVLAVVRAWHQLPDENAVYGSGGVFATLQAIAITPPALAGLATLLLAAGVCILLGLINRSFIIIHTTSVLYMGLFTALLTSMIAVTATDVNGMLLAAVVLCTLFIMYGSYQNARHTRRLFMVFCLLSAGAMFDWAYAVFIPVMLIGCVQMRCLTLRSFTAALIGIITPPWIIIGFGIADLGSFEPPVMKSMTGFLDESELWPVLGATAMMITLGLFTNISNMIRVYSQNARTRAFNGILTTITVFTELMCVLDFQRIASFAPILCCCVAFQTAQYFQFNAERRGYIVPATLLIGSALIYVWQLWIL